MLLCLATHFPEYKFYVLVFESCYLEHPGVLTRNQIERNHWDLYHHSSSGVGFPAEVALVTQHVDYGCRGGGRCPQHQLVCLGPGQEDSIHSSTLGCLLWGIPEKQTYSWMQAHHITLKNTCILNASINRFY